MNNFSNIDLDAWKDKQTKAHLNSYSSPSGDIEQVTDRNRINNLLSESDWHRKRELVKQFHDQGYIEVEAVY